MGEKEKIEKSEEAYFPVCYHCIAKAEPDPQIVKVSIKMDPSRQVQCCVICKRQTIEGLSAASSFLDLYFPKSMQFINN